MQMIVPILIGIAILVGFVALYMGRETWRVYHIVLGFFLIVANVLFLYLAARVLDTHRQWRGEVRKYETAYANQYEIYKKLTGELDGRGEVIVDRDEKSTQDWSIDDWKAELAEATFGRGRVLSGLVPKNVDPNTGVITAASSQGDVMLPAGSSVYVFQSERPIERNLDYRQSKIAITTAPIVNYVGAFQVSNVAGNTITLSPLQPERPTQINGPLVIYEVAPVDTHEAFAHLSDETIKKLFPPSVPAEVVQQYLNDGDPPESQDANSPHVWRTVRFVKEYSSPATQAPPTAQPAPAPADAAPADAAQPAETEGAVAARPTKFDPGDLAELDPQTAAELVKSGVAEYVPDNRGIYRRPLHDYPLAFRDVRAQLLVTNVKLEELQRQIAAIDKSIELAKQTQQLRQQEATRLAQDLEKFQFEAQTMQKLHDALTTSVKTATEQIESLKQSIRVAAEELTQLQLKAAEAIDRRAGATAAAR